MDGFEATAAIRELEKMTTGHVPIVGMTAHALKGDQEKCLADGMDAHVSKPIRTSELFGPIAKLLGQAPKPSATEASAPVAQQPNASLEEEPPVSALLPSNRS